MPLRFPRYADDEEVKGVNTKILRKIVKKINSQYQREDDDIRVASNLGNSIFSQPRGYISSGILPIDCIVCYGLGFPTAIIEIYGGEATGKTAIVEMTLAEAQRHGYYTVLIATEYALDYKRARAVGLKDDELIILDSETVEDVYEQVKSTVREIRAEDQDTPIVIGWDSIAATPTRAEIAEKADLETSDMGNSARQMSKMFRRMQGFLFKNKVCMICLNQTRVNLAQMWGSKESTYGGRALKFYAHVRMRVRKVKDIKGTDGETIGGLYEAECVKNRVAPPRRKCRYPIYWSRGIDSTLSVWEYAVDRKVFKKKGTAYSYKGQTMTRNSFVKYYARHKQEIDAVLRSSTSEGV